MVRFPPLPWVPAPDRLVRQAPRHSPHQGRAQALLHLPGLLRPGAGGDGLRPRPPAPHQPLRRLAQPPQHPGRQQLSHQGLLLPAGGPAPGPRAERALPRGRLPHPPAGGLRLPPLLLHRRRLSGGKTTSSPAPSTASRRPACAAFPVYTLNRRMWTLLATEHFGPVVQTEVGAWWWGGSSPSGRAAASGRGRRWAALSWPAPPSCSYLSGDASSSSPGAAPQSGRGAGEVRVFQGMWIATGPGGSDHG